MNLVPIIPQRRSEPIADPAWAAELNLDGFRGIADTITGRFTGKRAEVLSMIGTLTGKYFYGIIHAGKSEVHGVVVEEVGRDSMFLLVRYFDWNTHDVELRLTRVVRLDAVLEAGWRFFQTKQDLLDWLKETDSDTF